MKVIIIGLGSMGKRRLRLIKQIDTSIEVCGVDISEKRRKFCEEGYKIQTFKTLKDAFEEEFDCAFVSTSPLSHAEVIQECLLHDIHVFTEINLVADKYDENIQLAKMKKKVLFLSSTPIYKREMQFIIKTLARKKNVQYLYHVGQYLPDWHPWEDYKDFFVGDKRTNGCREIMAIEFPWIIKAFGMITNVNVLKNKLTTLSIDFPDSYVIQVQHKTGIYGIFVVDVVCRCAVRKLEIYNEDFYIEWGGKPETLFYKDALEIKTPCVFEKHEVEQGYSDLINELAYKDEIEEFFAVVKGTTEPKYSMQLDKEVLSWIDRIEGCL